MKLTMLGVADMQAFIGIDDEPFQKSLALSGRKPKIWQFLKLVSRARFISQVEASLRVRWSEIEIRSGTHDFAQIPLLGDGIELKLPRHCPLVEIIRATAIDAVAAGCWGTYDYAELDDGENKPVRRIDLDSERCIELLKATSLTLTLLMLAPGFILVQFDIEVAETSEPPENGGPTNFMHYWNAIAYCVELATYSKETFLECYEGEGDPVVAMEAIPTAGLFDDALVAFIKVLADHLRAEVPREVLPYQTDALEAGFYSVFRCSDDEDCVEALKTVAWQNEHSALSKVKADSYVAYLGWSGAFFASPSNMVGRDRKAMYNIRQCMMVYNIYFFYERYLGALLTNQVFKTNALLTPKKLAAQRRFGDAIHYLADLRRGSQYGSDRRFYDAWIEIAGLDALRSKTEAGLAQIITRLEDRHKQVTAWYVQSFAIITSIIGLSSILGWVTGLQSYFKEAADIHYSVPAIFVDVFATDNGRPLLAIYGIFALLIGAINLPPVMRWLRHRRH